MLEDDAERSERGEDALLSRVEAKDSWLAMDDERDESVGDIE